MCSTFPAHNGTFPAHSGTFSAHNGTFSAHIGTFPAHNVSPFLQNGKSRPAFKVKAGGPGCSGSACGLPSALQYRPPAPPARARRRYGRENERRSKPCGEPDDCGGVWPEECANVARPCLSGQNRKFSMSKTKVFDVVGFRSTPSPGTNVACAPSAVGYVCGGFEILNFSSSQAYEAHMAAYKYEKAACNRRFQGPFGSL